MFQIKIHPSMVTSASMSRLFAIIALSRIFKASTRRSKSSICFWSVLSFIPVLGSVSLVGFFNKSSAFVYSVQTLALKDPCLARATVLHAPSAKLMSPDLMASLPHSASRSCMIGVIFDDFYATAGSSETLAGEIDDIKSCSSFSI